MMNDMFVLGFDDIFVTSAYRRYVDQETLFEGYISKEMQRNPALSREEAKEIVLTYSSEPGKSEHQTGLCVDFMTPAMRELENYGHEGAYSDDIGFAETDAFLWLIENSWKYGFILRYPEDKVAITGYSYESWHYRFVGLETAAVIHQTGLCYEEYLETFK
jgi:D-alanyl-D-alanine carboxypeptidase